MKQANKLSRMVVTRKRVTEILERGRSDGQQISNTFAKSTSECRLCAWQRSGPKASGGAKTTTAASTAGATSCTAKADCECER
jgi:hypothetical protein